jgi:hypothetical protein
MVCHGFHLLHFPSKRPRSTVTSSVYGRKRPRTFTIRTFFSPYIAVHDTKIYDRDTITCKPPYFNVYGRLRPCLFDLERYFENYLVFVEWCWCWCRDLEQTTND